MIRNSKLIIDLHGKLISLKAQVITVSLFFVCLFSNAQNQQIADSLIQVYKRLNVDDSSYLETLKNISSKHTNPDKKLFYAKKLIDISSKKAKYRWLYRGYLQQGNAYRLKGDLDEAIKSYFLCLKAANSANYNAGKGGGYIALGDIYSIDGNHINSIFYYNKAISILRVENDSITLATALLNVGDEYFNTDEFDSALLYFSESGEIFNLINYKIGKAYNLGNIGLVYAEQGRHKLAEENIVEATKILQELGDNYPIAVYNTYMADIYKAKGDMPRALAYAQHSYSLAMAGGLKEQIRDASHTLSELYQEAEAYKKAYQFQEEYIAYRDSINNEETIRVMADLRTEYEVSQKQIEVDLLHEKHRLNKIIGTALFGVILLMGALAFVLNKKNKEKRIANKLLAAQKDQLEIQHNELDTLNATKDRFFSIISHDLRGPVNSFKGLTTLLKMSLVGKKYEELPKITDMLDKASSQISQLLDNLLDWAVNQQGEFPYNPEPIAMANLVEEVLDGTKARAAVKNIDIKIRMADDVTAWVDKNSVKTILRNLINNALKFTPQGGNIELIGSNEKKEVVLCVKDTGVGISKEKMATLFSINELKSTPGTDGEQGLGLGLRLVYEFVRMNKGVILVESEEKKGTTFKVSFPQSIVKS